MATLARVPLQSIENGTTVAKKKPLSSKQVRADQGARRKTATNPRDEIYIHSWLLLPPSQFGIQYNLGLTTTLRNPPRVDDIGNSKLHKATNKCPFECKMGLLKSVLTQHHPQGASLIYVREIFEVGDPECYPLWKLGSAVDVRTLTQEQVDRLRLMIVDRTWSVLMRRYLEHFANISFTGASRVFEDFDNFKKQYSKIRHQKVKFHMIFCITFALFKFDGWMYRHDLGFARIKLVKGLALRWKNLLCTRCPEELGLDVEFSYPALQSLLALFKERIGKISGYDPKNVFQYE